MSDPHFICPHCSQHLEAPSDMSGENISCPACGRTITVPPLSGPPPMPDPAARIVKADRLPLQKRCARNLAIVVGCAVVLIWGIASLIRHAPDSQTSPTRHFFAKQGQPLPIDETPLLADTQSSIDKSLVFFRYIDLLSSDWPAVTTNQDAFAKSVATYRRQLALAREYVQSAALDNEYEGLLSAQEELLTVYLAVLRSMNNIDENALVRAEREVTESSYNAGFAGGQAAAVAANNDAGFVGSALVGLGTYALGMWLEESEKSTVRNQAYGELVQREIQKYDSACAQYEALVRKSSQTLATRHGWRAEESGCAMPQAHLEQKQTAANNGDWAALASLLKSECSARPRDPFVMAQCSWAAAWARGANEDAATYDRCDKLLMSALAFIPTDGFYDSIRSAYYAEAGRCALSKTHLTSKNKGYVNGPFDSSRAIRLFLAARKYDPYDSSGWIRLQLGRAYAYASHFDKALTLYNEIQGLYSLDSGFMYDLACVYSAARQCENAWMIFQKCINECQYANIQWAQNDPDLAEVRKRYAAEFQRLTAIRTRADIEWGIMWDDPVLRNDSPFPLTNVRFTPRIASKGKLYTKELTIQYLAPGAGWRWPDVFSIPGSTFDAYNYSVVSDQGTASTQ